MEAKIIRECDMFNRAITFWNANSGDLGPKGIGYYNGLINDRDQLVAAGATQKGAKVTAQNALVLALEATLHDIVRTANAIAQDVPGFNDRFALPQHYNPGEIVATANAYLALLTPAAGDDAATTAAKAARVTAFTDHGLLGTFVADLRAQVAGIGTAKDTHEGSREQGVASTAVIAQLVRDGRKQVNYLDVFANNLYKGNTEQLAKWATASHIERDPVHEKTPPPAPATTGTAAPATPATATAK